MRKSLLWFVLVVSYVCFKVNDVYGKSSSVADKHDNGNESRSTKLLNVKNTSKESDTSLQLEKNSKDKAQYSKHTESTNLTIDINHGRNIGSKTITHVRVNTIDNPKNTSSYVKSRSSQINSSSEETMKTKGEINIRGSKGNNNSLEKSNEILKRTEKIEERNNEQPIKSTVKNPKETNSREKLNTPEGKYKISQQGKNSVHSAKSSIKNPLQIQKTPAKNVDSKTSVQHRKNTGQITNNNESKSQRKISVNVNPSSTSKNKPKSLKTEKEEERLANRNKNDNKAKAKSKLLDPKSEISSAETQNGKSQTKRAKKLLVSFFHSELDDDERVEGAHAKKTHVTKEREHGKDGSRIDSNYLQDQEAMLTEIEDKLYKRTGLEAQPQVTGQNNKIIETVLPSGPNAIKPQHISSSEPTHVMFKPVHKYYPAIHRYMTKPIHRYLKKPVDLNGMNTPLEGQEFTEESPSSLKEYTAPPDHGHGVGIPQFVVNRINPHHFVSGRLVDQQRIVGLPLQMKSYDSPPGRVHDVDIPQAVQPSAVQQVEDSGGLLDDQASQQKHYDGNVGGARPRIVPPNLVAGFVHGHRVIQDGGRHVGPVRIFTQLPPRIQPILVHPHRLSPSGFGPCTTNPCKNSGVCSTVSNQAMCICKSGFRGKFCELINKCHPNPCHNYGSCTENERDFECSCKKGYRGKRCEVENKCEPSPCVNGGTCSESEDDYVCTCREGFLGHSCEVESKCSPINPCKNGATCQEARDTYKCFCRDGFGGYNCEARIRRDICLPNPCKNGGFCTVTGTSTGNYTCSCPHGWKGSTCVEKVDSWGNSQGPTICESVNPCMFGGKCTPISYYDYTCTCPHGRGGAHCEQDLNHPKFVSSCSHCHAFARCLDGHCSCKEGYEGDGRNCETVQQFCHPNPCYNGGTCRQSTNQKREISGGKPWWCDCPTGYKGLNCEDMDLCLMRLCQNGGSCLSSQGQTKCLCPPAYRGKYCQEKNVCHGNPCKNGGSCKAVEGVATCSCPQEYEGTYCQNWKCSKCDRHSTCVKGSCVCNEGYIGDGMACRPPKVAPPGSSAAPAPAPAPPPPPPAPPPPTIRKYCESNPCMNGATCLEALETYFCQCPENKYGKQCDQTPAVITDLCSKCDIDATCRDGRCVCNEGFNGNGFSCRKSTPQLAEVSALSTPRETDSSCDFCPENGQCLDNVCVCPPGFENTKRSCVAIDLPRIRSTALAKTLLSGVEHVGTTRNRLPIGQWKESSVVTEYHSLGCWADTKDWRNPIMRAIESLEGLHPALNDDYKRRKNPITKCATATKAYGYKIFAVQNGGQCFSDTNAGKTYTTYGPSTQCRFGVGGNLANDVYKL